MEITIKLFVATLLTRVRILNTINHILVFAAVTWCESFLFARKAWTMMAISLTFMFQTVQYFLTFFTTLKDLSLFTTFNHPRTFSALTIYQVALVLARLAFSFMAKLRTWMRTKRSSFPATNLSTTMWLNISLKLWAHEFTTETIVFGHWLIILEFALRATPKEQNLVFIFISINIENPRFNAFEMHRKIATVARPYMIFLSDKLRANNAALILNLAAYSFNKPRFLVILSFWLFGHLSFMFLLFLEFLLFCNVFWFLIQLLSFIRSSFLNIFLFYSLLHYFNQRIIKLI